MDIEHYIRFVAALVAVLALIVAALWLLKRLGMAGVAAGTGRGRRRLTVVEAVALDTRRRLVLVRRDGVEHLLLLGATGDLVVESGVRDAFAANLAETDAGPTPALQLKPPLDAALPELAPRPEAAP